MGILYGTYIHMLSGGSLEHRTSLGYSVSCTSCNLCKDDRVVHACAVCLTNSMGSLGVGRRCA